MRFLVALFLLFLLPGVLTAFWQEFNALLHSGGSTYLLAGALLGSILHFLALRRLYRLTIFEHELTHALAALLFLRRITRFVVRTDGGNVQHTGGFGGRVGDEFIGLAPYILPTFTFLSVLIRPLVRSWQPWFDIWIGLTFGFHLWSTLAETWEGLTRRPFRSAGSGEWVRSDLGRRGLVYSILFIVTSSFAIHGLMIGMFLRSYAGVIGWGRNVWSGSVRGTGQAFIILGRLIDRIS